MTDSMTRWLHDQGLPQYAQAFEENHIDLSLLPQLDHDALIELGVQSLGHRLTLLAAIATTSASPAVRQAGANNGIHNDSMTERRQLTVMFCDLVNSTELALQYDVEDLRHIITTYQNHAEPIVGRYEGRIAQYLGDGLLVYFGYPVAHEDDAARAVHAGLDLISELDDLNRQLRHSHGVDLSMRIGIHTGPVIVGQIGSDSGAAFLATGETPNRASELQHLARVNGVSISQATSALLGENFTVEKSEESVFHVLGRRSLETRFDAHSSRRRISLIGRKHELQMLCSAWADTESGKSQFVCLTGEAGIGKSHLVNALREKIPAERGHCIVYQCSPYHRDSPLYPVSRHLKRALTKDKQPNQLPTLDELEVMISRSSGHSSHASREIKHRAHLLASLVDLDSEAIERYGKLVYSPREWRELILQHLLDQLRSLTFQQPILLVLEDIQWSDATTLALVEQTLCWRDTRVMILMTCRPDAQPHWCTGEPVKSLALDKLKAESIERIVELVAKAYNHALDVKTSTRLVERSDGLPLYAEELTKAFLSTEIKVLSSADEGSGDRRSEREPFDMAELIPTSLHDSLLARLDQMQSAKAAAQIAACIGREFRQEELQAVCSESDSNLREALHQLRASEILVRDDTKSDIGLYMFRHALMRDAAYESLPRSRREYVHGRLLDELSSRTTSSPDVLAHHAFHAKRFHEAAIQYDTAGQKAARGAAFKEALAHFDNALLCAQQIPDTTTEKKLQLNILVHQGHASTALNGFAHPTTARINIEARKLLDFVTDSPFESAVLYGHWVIQHALGQHLTAEKDANALYRANASSKDRVKRLVGNRVRGSTRLMQGRLNEATADLCEAASLGDEQADRELAAQFGMNLIVPVRTYLALVQVCQGNSTLALNTLDGLEASVRDHAHPGTMIYAFSHLALVSQAGRLPSRDHYVVIADQLAKEHGLRAYQGHTLGIKAMNLLENDKVQASVDCMEEALSIIAQTKTQIYTPLLYGHYALSLAHLGEYEKSTSAISIGMDIAKANHELWAMAEVMRLDAVSKAMAGQPFERTRAMLTSSMSLADEQGAHLWSLKSALSLAQLQEANGRELSDAEHILSVKLDSVNKTGGELTDWQDACDLLARLRKTQANI